MKLVTYVYEGMEAVGAVTPDMTAVAALPALGVPCREMTEAIRYLGAVSYTHLTLPTN